MPSKDNKKLLKENKKLTKASKRPPSIKETDKMPNKKKQHSVLKRCTIELTKSNSKATTVS